MEWCEEDGDDGDFISTILTIVKNGDYDLKTFSARRSFCATLCLSVVRGGGGV